jgi:hypothetical protein
MGYYFEIRPRDRKPLSVEDYKTRFLKIGLAPHPALTHPDEDEEVRKKYVDDVMYSGGVISVVAWKDTPCGVTTEARVSWSEDADSIASIVQELLEIADQVNAELYTGNNQLVTKTDIQHAVNIFLKGKRIGLGALGTVDSEKIVRGTEGQSLEGSP